MRWKARAEGKRRLHNIWRMALFPGESAQMFAGGVEGADGFNFAGAQFGVLVETEPGEALGLAGAGGFSSETPV